MTFWDYYFLRIFTLKHKTLHIQDNYKWIYKQTTIFNTGKEVWHLFQDYYFMLQI